MRRPPYDLPVQAQQYDADRYANPTEATMGEYSDGGLVADEDPGHHGGPDRSKPYTPGYLASLHPGTHPGRDLGLRRFRLNRAIDSSGVSGLGYVAHGVEFPDGVCAMHWAVGFASTGIYTNIAELTAIHGHHGDTRIEWLD